MEELRPDWYSLFNTIKDTQRFTNALLARYGDKLPGETLKQIGSWMADIGINMKNYSKESINQYHQLRQAIEPYMDYGGGMGKGAMTILPFLKSAAGITAAGLGGWRLGKTLGQTPLMTDPNMTYNQFYTNLFSNLFNQFSPKIPTISQYNYGNNY